MYRYHRVLVALNLDDHDETLVRYAAHVAEMAQSDSVAFLHVATSPARFAAEVTPDLVPELSGDLEDMVEPSSQGHMKEVEALVKEIFPEERHASLKHEVAYGTEMKELLTRARDEGTDLIIVGKSLHDSSLAEKLARKAPCSVLVVPDGASDKIESVMAAVDFSEHSAYAVDVATAFGEAADLDCFHTTYVFSVPSGYYKAGKSREEFIKLMRARASARHEEFIAGVNTRGLNVEPHLVLSEDVPEALANAALHVRADLVVVGTRGRSPGAAVLMGSVTEALIRRADRPIVAVKKKGENLGILDALLNL